MIYRLFLLLAILGFNLASTCPKLQCSNAIPTRYTADPEVCANKTVSPTGEITFRLTNCSSTKQSCNFIYAQNISYCKDKADYAAYAYPGESCYYDTNCLSKKCKENICVGALLNETCVQDWNCEPGLFCNKTKCHTLVAEGALCGSNGNKCKNHLTCSLGKCVLLGSLADGMAADTPLACKNYFLLKDDSGVMRCSIGPTLDSDFTVPCVLGTPCNYTLGDKKYQLPCRCGLTAATTGYCSPGAGKLAGDIAMV